MAVGRQDLGQQRIGDQALQLLRQGGVMAGAGFLVGNDVFLGPNVTLANDMWPGATKDGYDDEALRSGKVWAVIIGEGSIIGANAIVSVR